MSNAEDAAAAPPGEEVKPYKIHVSDATTPASKEKPAVADAMRLSFFDIGFDKVSRSHEEEARAHATPS